MEIFNKFIDWKKNIEVNRIEGFVAKFDLKQISFNKLVGFLKKNINLLEYGDISASMQNDEYTIESFGEGKLLIINDSNSGKTILRLDENIVAKKNIYTIDFKINLQNIKTEFIEEIVGVYGFSFGIFYNPNNVKWENNDVPNNYKYKKGIKTYLNKKLGVIRVDLSERPGRYLALKQYAWHGGNQYWFSKDLFNEFELKNLVRIDNQIKIEFLTKDIIHIWLFEPNTYWSNKSQSILKSFRNYLEKRNF